MERSNESPNEGGSSPDTVIGRSSSEEDRKRRTNTTTGSTSGEYVTGVGESSSSLDTLVGSNAGAGVKGNLQLSSSSTAIEDLGKKKGRFGALKNTFRKIKRTKSKSVESEGSVDIDPDDEEGSKASGRKLSQTREDEDRISLAGGSQPISGSSPIETAATGKKKKKRNSLVRKLSLNKFRLSSSDHHHQQQQQQQHNQETTRHTPEGGDSSRSQSQSSQESPCYANSPSKIATKKGLSVDEHQLSQQQQQNNQLYQDRDCGSDETLEKRRSPTDRRDVGKLAVDSWGSDREKGAPATATATGIQQTSSQRVQDEAQRPLKPVSTVTVVQRQSPSLTIRTNFTQKQQEQQETNKNIHGIPEYHEKKQPIQCSVSTLPYAISKWSESTQEPLDSTKKPKLSIKADSESAAITPTTPPVELRRKLSLLEEKRAIFQRRRYETSQDSSDDQSYDTVVAASGDSVRKDSYDPDTTKKKVRHISVRKFDTFSTFEGTFDEDTGVGYLAGIEEDYSERDCTHDIYDEYKNLEGDYEDEKRRMQNIEENLDNSRSLSQDSASSQNNVPNAGIGEKREHLYKILVIGELGAGKTSIIKRYVHQFFSQHYRATIGVDFALKVLNWDPHTIIRLQLWDIAGQERFGNMTRVYYKEAVGAFIVFDVTRSATLEAVVKWKQDLDSKVQLPDGSPIPCVLLANKCDQQKEGLVNTPAKMDEYCKEKNFSGWFETSAKENINIEEAARFLVNKILQNDQIMKGNSSQEQTDGERFALNQSPTSSKKSCSC